MNYYTNARIFTGSEWIENGTVVTNDGSIVTVTKDPLPFDAAHKNCEGHLLVPALLDLQVYGAGGKLFAENPEPASLAVLAEENRKGGVVACLATIATQPRDIIYKSISAINDYWAQGGSGILGMHLEGPFINPKKRGAHIEEWIHVPTETEVAELIRFANGAIKMVTLAPELCPAPIIKMFINAGIKVAAGHSNATYQEAMQFPALGVETVTHLFNAMSPLHHRDIGLPGAVFENETLHASIIPDGIHVSYSTLRLAKKQMGERLYFITDAVTETTTGKYPHHLQIDRYCMPDGTLSGSAISLLQGVRNAIQFAGINLDEALRMASLYPAQLMGLDADHGSIEAGRRAAFLLLDRELGLVEVV